MINLHQIDCREFMKTVPDKCFDLAIVDPLYGIGADNFSNGTNLTRSKDGYAAESTATKIKKNRLNSGGGKLKNRLLNNSNCSWDVKPDDEYFKQLFRVSKAQIIWGGNYFPLPPTRGVICWDKMQPWDNFSQFELAWSSFDVPAKMFRYSNTGGRNQEIKIHPTQKPVALYKWLLSTFAKPGWKVIDTHLGSGSSAIACYDDGFDLEACEIDKIYYQSAVERLEKHKQQITFNF